MKRGVAGDALAVDLVANPDIAAASAARMKAGSVAVGFALETSALRARARRKLDAKGFDLIVANRAGEKGAGFEIDTNRVTIIVRGEQPREASP